MLDFHVCFTDQRIKLVVKKPPKTTLNIAPQAGNCSFSVAAWQKDDITKSSHVLFYGQTGHKQSQSQIILWDSLCCNYLLSVLQQHLVVQIKIRNKLSWHMISAGRAYIENRMERIVCGKLRQRAG